MIAGLEGKLATIGADHIVVNVNGVYYDPTPELVERGQFSYAGPPRQEGDSLVASFYEMSQPLGDGDSTVPRSSGSVLTVGGAPGIPLSGPTYWPWPGSSWPRCSHCPTS